MQLNNNIDHFVIGAKSLSQGAKFIKNHFGVQMPFGGEHPKMGTHNLLMQLADDLFFEVIAINSDSDEPKHTRWYGLDDDKVKAQIENEPKLLTWVINTDDISSLLNKVDYDFGQAQLISRGNLNWYFALHRDGRLLEGGLIPYLMQWNTDAHPAANMISLGCSFVSLSIYHHNIDWLGSILKSLGVNKAVNIYHADKPNDSKLSLCLETPKGVVELSTLKI